MTAWRQKVPPNSAQVAAYFLRADVIPYVVQGPDGPLHGDFHTLRHSCITALGRSGVKGPDPTTEEILRRLPRHLIYREVDEMGCWGWLHFPLL
jgi:hypothetical protein